MKKARYHGFALFLLVIASLLKKVELAISKKRSGNSGLCLTWDPPKDFSRIQHGHGPNFVSRLAKPYPWLIYRHSTPASSFFRHACCNIMLVTAGLQGRYWEKAEGLRVGRQIIAREPHHALARKVAG